MRKLAIAAALLAATLVGPPAAGATSLRQAGGATVTTLSPSEMIRQAGYPLTAADAAFIDADQAFGQQYSTALLQVVALGGPGTGPPDAAMQGAVMAVAQRLAALDPNATPEAPASLQRLRALAVEQRQFAQRAANAWLAGLQAGDADWWARGADDFAAANQSLQGWQQEFVAQYPPPQGRP